jgi:hypothetical protein
MGLRSFSIMSVLNTIWRRESEFLMATAAIVHATTGPKMGSCAAASAPGTRIGVNFFTEAF